MVDEIRDVAIHRRGIIIISALIAIAAIINNTAWLIGQWWSDAVIAFRQWHRQQERKGTGV